MCGFLWGIGHTERCGNGLKAATFPCNVGDLLLCEKYLSKKCVAAEVAIRGDI